MESVGRLAGGVAHDFNNMQEHQGPIHLLVTDVVMPEMNGKDLRKSIAALRPEIKTLFISGYTSDVIAPHGVLEDNVQYQQKPFSVTALAAKVREVLDSGSAMVFTAEGPRTQGEN